MLINPDILGKVREGIHSIRIFDFAVFDILATILLAGFISRVARIAILPVLLATFIAGEALHLIIGVKTKFVTIITNYWPFSQIKS
jgi:preprotein translocase subunit SecD